MLDLAEKLLLEMKLKEHFEGDKKQYVVTREQLIELVIKYNRLLTEIINKERDE